MYPTHSEAKLKHQFRAEKGSLQDQGREYGGACVQKTQNWDPLGSPVVTTPGFHCRGHRFDLWLGH